MKKFISMLLIVSLVFCMFSVPVMARNRIISPEHDNTVVVPEPKPTPTPDESVTPVQPSQPSSPQTGGLNIVVYLVLAVLLCGTAVVTMRKALIA